MKTSQISLVCLLLGLGVAAAGPAKDVDSAIYGFADQFYQKLVRDKDHSGNGVHSSLALNLALAKMDFGAGTSTKTELHKALQLPEAKGKVEAGYTAVINQFSKTTDVTFTIANRLYVSQDININEPYKNTIKRVFKADIEKVDFSAENSAVAINDWAKKQSGGQIKKIIENDDITDASKGIFLSLMYFKGDWNTAFGNSKTRRFFVAGGEPVVVPIMSAVGKFRSGEVKNVPAKFIMIPFKNSDFNLIIFRPNAENGFDTVRKGIEKIDLSNMLNAGIAIEQKIIMPKFKIEKTIDVQPIVEKMGITKAFTPDVADFSGITNELFHVGKFIHKTILEANEKGVNSGSGVGSPGQETELLTRYNEFDVNRSFIAKLVHITSNDGEIEKVTPLLAVDVKDPTKN